MDQEDDEEGEGSTVKGYIIYEEKKEEQKQEEKEVKEEKPAVDEEKIQTEGADKSEKGEAELEEDAFEKLFKGKRVKEFLPLLFDGK